MAHEWIDKGICQITVNNPAKFNALSSEIIAELVSDFTEVCSEPLARVIIFRGAEVPGKRLAPLAGADLSQLVKVEGEVYSAIPADLAREHMEEGVQAIRKIRELCRRNGVRDDSGQLVGRVLVLGMVDGHCLAGGIEFMFGLSDIVIATFRSKFGMREIILGGMGGWGGPETLRRIFGNPICVKEMLLGLGEEEGGDISAEIALARGLVNRLVPEEEIEGHVEAMAQHVVSLDPLAVTYNLEAADFPVERNCTPQVTEWMTTLITRKAWINGVEAFDKGQRR